MSGREPSPIPLHNFRLASRPGKLQTLNFSSYENLSIALRPQEASKSCKKNCLSPKEIHVGKLDGCTARRLVVFARSGIRNFSWPRETSFILTSHVFFFFFFPFLSSCLTFPYVREEVLKDFISKACRWSWQSWTSMVKHRNEKMDLRWKEKMVFKNSLVEKRSNKNDNLYNIFKNFAIPSFQYWFVPLNW